MAEDSGHGTSAAFGSLVSGGFFSSDPDSAGVPRPIRTNNPGALNVSPWQRTRPGFVGATPTDAVGNITAIYRTPEHGIASWYHLLRAVYGFAATGSFTLEQLASKFAGAGAPSASVNAFLTAWKRFLPSDVDASQPFQTDDDKKMLALAKAMFKNESGGRLPWSDEQIAYALKNERENTLPP